MTISRSLRGVIETLSRAVSTLRTCCDDLFLKYNLLDSTWYPGTRYVTCREYRTTLQLIQYRIKNACRREAPKARETERGGKSNNGRQTKMRRRVVHATVEYLVRSSKE